MIDKEQVIRLIKANGPVIPSDLTKGLNADTLLIGAVLSELVANKRLLITALKRGGSPYYYLPEQKMQIEALSKYLNEKDRRTFEIIKEKKILRDRDMVPLARVSLRNISDYAKPVEVRLNGEQELFWKWHMLENGDVARMLKNMLLKKEEEMLEKVVLNKPLEKTAVLPITMAGTFKNDAQNKCADKKKVQKIEQEQTVICSKEMKKTRKSSEELKHAAAQKSGQKKELLDKEEKKLLGAAERLLKLKEKQQKLIAEDKLYARLELFFKQNSITAKEVSIRKKNKEIECVILLPTPVGDVKYFCKAKDKKKCNDNDLACAYVDGQSRKLPILFITTGEITKKAVGRIGKDFNNMKVRVI